VAIVINKYVEIKLCNILNVGGGGTSTILNGCVQEGINSWFSPLARVLPTLGINLNDRTSPQTLKSKLQTKFINAWEERIMQSKKLRTYTKFKTHYRMEPYLLHLKDRHKRAQVCRIRVSAHTLAIQGLLLQGPKSQMRDAQEQLRHEKGENHRSFATLSYRAI